jgi:hypothetical protein
MDLKTVWGVLIFVGGVLVLAYIFFVKIPKIFENFGERESRNNLQDDSSSVMRRD